MIPSRPSGLVKRFQRHGWMMGQATGVLAARGRLHRLCGEDPSRPAESWWAGPKPLTACLAARLLRSDLYLQAPDKPRPHPALPWGHTEPPGSMLSNAELVGERAAALILSSQCPCWSLREQCRGSSELRGRRGGGGCGGGGAAEESSLDSQPREGLEGNPWPCLSGPDYSLLPTGAAPRRPAFPLPLSTPIVRLQRTGKRKSPPNVMRKKG